MNDQQTEQMIQAKGLTAPRVTPQDVENEIVHEHYLRASENVSTFPTAEAHKYIPLTLLTFCVLVLKNGFTVTGESACASPENFDAEIGRKIARQKAIEKVWPLLGFRLRDKLAAQPADWRERVLQEKAALDEKIKALNAFTGSPKWEDLRINEQNDLLLQLQNMAGYSQALARRITSWQMPKDE